MENTETIYKVGDKVWSPAFGWGEVVNIDMAMLYPVKVSYPNKPEYTYTLDGRLYADAPISLFFTEQQYSVERPKWQPKEGEWCWFWDDGVQTSCSLGQFGNMQGARYVKLDSAYKGIAWDNCAPFVGELPPHLKD